MTLDPRRAQHIDELLTLVREGRAPPEFVFPTRNADEAVLVRTYLRGRKGNAAFLVEEGGCRW